MHNGRNGDSDSIKATVLVRVGAEVDGLDIGRKLVFDGVARSEGGGRRRCKWWPSVASRGRFRREELDPRWGKGTGRRALMR
jgi:hypothetical protein